MRKSKVVIEHLPTSISIRDNKYSCKGCPLSIYANENDKVMLGCGNIHARTMLVLTPYNVNASIDYLTCLKVLIDLYRNETGRELLDDSYVTRGIKCLNKSPYNLYEQAVSHCYTYFRYECNKLKPRKIISFNTNIYNIKGYNVVTITHPGVMFYNNEELKKKFKLEFIKEMLL